MLDSSPWWLAPLGQLLGAEPREHWIVSRPQPATWSELRSLSLPLGLSATKTPKSEAGVACGLALRTGHLDEAHRYVQDSGVPLEMAWHGVMHRLEGDLWNSKYWFRRVGKLAIYDHLARQATETPGLSKAVVQRVVAGNSLRWQMDAWIDLWGDRTLESDSAMKTSATQLAIAEWELLFNESLGVE